MSLKEALESISLEPVSFGWTALRIHRPEEREEAQIGYSIDPDGRSLVSDEEGSWKDNWVVIGYEDLIGDPIFVDVGVEGYPVYTAMHGTGSWNPILIARSIRFSEALGIIAVLSEGRDNPEELRRNPLPITERDEAIQKIRELDPNIDIGFWERWLAPYDS